MRDGVSAYYSHAAALERLSVSELRPLFGRQLQIGTALCKSLSVPLALNAQVGEDARSSLHGPVHLDMYFFVKLSLYSPNGPSEITHQC
jgi:hypothetical protein